VPHGHLLVRGAPITTAQLRRRLIEEGVLEARCSRCGLSEWQGQPIPLELDHINGDRRDNRLVNLRLLCPNCHALTDTYCGRNIGRYATEVDEDHAEAGE
jgi:Zn finger protein HypA/HybF involved in hydrogenase expression